MTSISTWNRRRAAIRDRISNPKDAYPLCLVPDCNQATLASARKGLNRHYCRRHAEHYRRHGSYSKPSYSARELNPYRTGADHWLSLNGDKPEVREALGRVEFLYWRAGRTESAFRLAGRSTKERARITWATLRERQVNPRHVLAVWLAVHLRHANDPQREVRVDYRRVQGAKVLHRLAGGTHKRWERLRNDGTVEVTCLHKYPASRGIVLRLVGRQLAWAATPLEAVLLGDSSQLIPVEAYQAKRLAAIRRRPGRAP